MSKDTELIALYLSNELSAADKQKFEARLATDTELRKNLDLQRQVLQGIQQAGRRAEVKSGIKSAKLTKALKQIGTWALIAGASAALAFGAASYYKNKGAENLKYELNEEGQANWSQADKVLPSQFMEISADSDAVIESKNGLVFAIPANAFIDEKGNTVQGDIEIEVKEALTPFDIMKAGLSTMSNNTQLETGGMFYINARKDGKNLTLIKDKAITAAVPNLNKNADMQLFDGVRSYSHDGLEMPKDAESKINWVNPRPFETKLSKRDILKLNFYPPGFLDTLKTMGFDIKNKTLTDSIYYSISCRSGYVDESSEVTADTTSAMWDSEGQPYQISVAAHVGQSPTGQQLFRQNCAVCHSSGKQRLTGPGLAGVIQRAPNRDWLHHWITNNQKLIKSGDAYANKIYNAYGMAQMTIFEGLLNEEDIDAILNFLVKSESNANCEIDPMRIKAIWNKDYASTILATKEFEKRLSFIFKTCNPSILEIYTKGIDKKMYQCDSIAAEALYLKGNRDMADQFQQFYLEKKGGLLVDEKHLQKLNATLDERTKLYTEAREKALEKMYEKERITSVEQFEKRFKHDTAEGTRMSMVLLEEIDLNLKEAYKKLGKEKPKLVLPGDAYLTATIVTTGWKNVDAYVTAATIARKSMIYIDPVTFKKAEINYRPFKISIENANEFERINAYVLPKQLSSFNRMNALSKSEFEFSLNEFIVYDAQVLGFKGDEVYSASLKDCKTGTQKLRLKKLSNADLQQLMQQPSMQDEIAYTQFEKADDARLAKITSRELLTERLRRIVFPCAAEPAQQPALEN